MGIISKTPAVGDLFIIRGLPGSGKSTLAEELCSHDKLGIHVESDDFS